MKQLLPEERLLVDDTAFAVAYRQIKLAKQFYGRFICHDDVRVSLRVLFKLASEILHVRLEGGDTQFIIFIVLRRVFADLRLFLISLPQSTRGFAH